MTNYVKPRQIGLFVVRRSFAGTVVYRGDDVRAATNVARRYKNAVLTFKTAAAAAEYLNA